MRLISSLPETLRQTPCRPNAAIGDHAPRRDTATKYIAERVFLRDILGQSAIFSAVRASTRVTASRAGSVAARRVAG
jgi:hypothetical protein